MLYDREYMRSPGGGAWRSPVIVLLIVLGVVFLAECILGGAPNPLIQQFGLNAQAVFRHEYHRLVTYQFLHDAPMPLHILFNGIALWFFGRGFLETQSRRRFWLVYLIAGVAGGLVEVACQAWHPRYSSHLTVGASASVLGLAGAFCLLHPAREIVFFLYVIPVRLRAMTMFWVLLAFSVFCTVFPSGGIAHAAHLGGLLAGAAFVKFFVDEEAAGWLRRFAPRPPVRREKVPVAAGEVAETRPVLKRKPPESAVETPDDFIRREVDPILEKISAHGLQSLTERERRILEQARERIRRR